MVELTDHPWFLGCQFHPEYKSRPTDPHPLFVSFIEAALAHQTRRAEGKTVELPRGVAEEISASAEVQ